MKRLKALGHVLSGLLLLLSAGSADALNPNHQCSFCHNLHGGVVPAPAIVENMCLTCHGPAGTALRKAAVHTNDSPSSYPAFRISCMGCHNPHDSLRNWLSGTNLMMVGTVQDATNLARIATPNSGIREVVFESRGPSWSQPSLHSYADDDQDGNGYRDGICETCHTLTKHHRNNAAANHNDGKSCTASCHLHTTNFLR